MWIDQCVPTVLNYSGSVVNYVSTGTFYQIQALGNGATVKALTSAGTVYGTTDVYSTSTGITMLPGERWEGKFLSVALYGGDVVLHELPGGNGEIVPYGVGTPYATVDDLPDYVADRKLTIMDRSTGTKTACCWVFHNEGVDACVVGRPANLIDIFDNTNKKAFSVSTVVSFNSSIIATRVYGMALVGSDPVSIALVNVNPSTIASAVGSSNSLSSATLDGTGVWTNYKIEATTTEQRIVKNGVASAYAARGSENSPLGFVIGATSAPPYTALNFEGDTAFIAIYSGSGALVDCYDFTDPTKWNGGITMVSCAGNTATFTDGSPTGIRKKVAIPRNLLVY